MENSSDKLLSAYKKKLAQTQVMVESSISVDTEEALSRILSVRSRARIDNRATELVSDEANLTGKLTIDLIYLTEANEVGNNKSTSNFSAKLQDADIDLSGRVFANAEVIDSVVQSVNGNVVKVVTTVEVTAYLITNREVPCITDTAPDMFAKTEELTMQYLLTDACETFKEDLTYNVKTGVKKVLLVESDVAVKEQTPGYNFVTVSGEINTKILFVNNNEIPELETVTVTSDFKQDLEINNVTQDMSIELCAKIVDDEVAVTLSENDDNSSTITVTNPVEVCVKVLEAKTAVCVGDLYSVKNEISTTTTSYQTTEDLGYETFDSKIEGGVTLSDSDPRVDKYLASGGTNLVVSNSYVQDGEIVVEGIAKTNIIYLNDELNSIYSVDVEVPFVLNNKTDFPDNAELEVMLSLKDADTIVKKGREVYFDAKVRVFASAYNVTTGAVLSNVEVVATLPEKDSAIEIYFAKTGETIWDIAKELKVPTDMIINQNPNLTDPLETDESLALYYKKTK